MKFPATISLRNALPICAMPNGIRTRDESSTFLNSMKMAPAVSGRR